MIKLMEPSLSLIVAKKDQPIVKSLLADCETEYEELMKKGTGKEYKCSLSLKEDKTFDSKTECGGVILVSKDGSIVCKNTISTKLALVYEQLLPEIRARLFPKK